MRIIDRENLSRYVKSGRLDEWDLLFAFLGGLLFCGIWMMNSWSGGVWGGYFWTFLSMYFLVGPGLICFGLYLLTIDPQEHVLRSFVVLVGVSFFFFVPVAWWGYQYELNQIIGLSLSGLEDAVAFSLFVLGFAYLKNEALKVAVGTIVVGIVGGSAAYFGWIVYMVSVSGSSTVNAWGLLISNSVWYGAMSSVWWGAAVLVNFLSGNGYAGMRNSIFIVVILQLSFYRLVLMRGTDLGIDLDNPWFVLGVAVFVVVYAIVLVGIATAYHWWAYQDG